jgi:hypothetical protein
MFLVGLGEVTEDVQRAIRGPNTKKKHGSIESCVRVCYPCKKRDDSIHYLVIVVTVN